MAVWVPEVRLCPPELYEPALNILYQRVPESLRARLVIDVLKEAQCGQVDLSGLWIASKHARRFSRASSQQQIVGALMTQPLAGRAAAVWAPEVQSSIRRHLIAKALVQTALSDLQFRSFQIAQAVLDESASRRGAQDLIHGGMPRVTELLYLERDTRIPLTTTRERAQLEWQSFNLVGESEFRQLLQATYRSSLDMPELEGVRSLEDIIQGHQAAGHFVPDLWQVGRIPGHPEIGAILLLSESAARDTWEIVYLGLTPSARGSGLGRQTLCRALELAQPHALRLELAVDIRNFPATRLYETAGFVVFDRRAVHLVVFPDYRQGS
jgi:ribosomal protein S18 acetylase RimI-like enzyme